MSVPPATTLGEPKNDEPAASKTEKPEEPKTEKPEKPEQPKAEKKAEGSGKSPLEAMGRALFKGFTGGSDQKKGPERRDAPSF
jgi:hypothetical protein